MNQQDQINELNLIVKCKLAPSKIAGVGVFAIRDIKKGDPLYLFPSPNPHWYSLPFGSMSKLWPEVRELILGQWASIVNGSHFLSPNDSCWMIVYVNHSDNPNYQTNGDIALRDIKKGEEITSDYCLMDNWQKVSPWLQPVDKLTLKDKLAKYLTF